MNNKETEKKCECEHGMFKEECVVCNSPQTATIQKKKCCERCATDFESNQCDCECHLPDVGKQKCKKHGVVHKNGGYPSCPPRPHKDYALYCPYHPESECKNPECALFVSPDVSEAWEKWVLTLSNSKNPHDKDLLIAKIKVLLSHAHQEAYEKGLKASHKTESGYCCACDYDMAVFNDDVHEVRIAERKDIVEAIEKDLSVVATNRTNAKEIDKDYFAGEFLALKRILSLIHNRSKEIKSNGSQPTAD